MDENNFENFIRINKFRVDKEFEKLLKPNDRGEWVMDPIIANAYYDPEQNSIGKFIINLNEKSYYFFSSVSRWYSPPAFL